MIDYTYKELYKQSSVQKNLSIKFETGEINNSQIYSESFELTESLCSEESLKFGSCEASCLKLKIANEFASLKNLWIDVTEVLNEYSDEPFSFGKYKVYSDVPTADRKYREIVAYDKMFDIINADVSIWYDTILPDEDSVVTLKEFRDSFAAYFGVEQEEVSLINDSMIIEKTIKPYSLSGKTVLCAICELNGCFGHISRSGKIKYVSMGNDGHAIDKSLYSSCKYEEFKTDNVTRLQIRQEENDIGCTVGNGENCYIVQDNFLVYGKNPTELEEIANNLLGVINTISYRPWEGILCGNPCIEVGDFVVVETDEESIVSYVLERTLRGIHSLHDNICAKGTKVYSEQVNSIKTEIKQLKSKTNLLERTVEETKSTISDTEKNLQSQITQTADSIKLEVSKTYATNKSVDDLKIEFDSIEGKFMYIRYSANSDGSNMTSSPQSDTQYMGTCSTNEKTAPTDKTRYVWCKVRGNDGAKGTEIVYEYAVSNSPTIPPGGLPVIGKLEKPRIYLEDTDGGVSITSILGKAILGRAVLGVSSGATNKLSTPDIYIENSTEAKLGTPTIYVEDVSASSYNVRHARAVTTSYSENVVWATTVPVRKEGEYIWQRVKYIFADGSAVISDPACLTGEKGEDGKDGKDGVGVKQVKEYYQVSPSNIVKPTTWIEDTIPKLTATNKYLWNYEEITYTNGDVTTTKPGIIGVFGNDGANGRGISEIIEYYALSTTSIDVPTSWQTTIPTLDRVNKYLWNYEVIKYTEGQDSRTDPCVIGVYGDTGPSGKDAVTYRIESSLGSIFLYDQNDITALTARIYRGSVEVDTSGNYGYTWYVVEKDGTERVIGNNKILEISASVIAGKGVYFVADDGGVVEEMGKLGTPIIELCNAGITTKLETPAIYLK